MPGTDDPALQLQLRDRGKLRFTKNGHNGTITIACVTYEGMLEVTGPDALRNALISGIGRARLRLRPAHPRRNGTGEPLTGMSPVAERFKQ
jgi:hypothetical protein